MARKIKESVINKAIDYFIKNNVRFIDVSAKFNISTATFSQYLKKRGIKVDSQRTRRGKPAWNTGLTKHNDLRVANNAKSLSDSKSKDRKLVSGYNTVYCEELKKTIKLHNYIWFKNTGYMPDGKKGEQVHHVDGNKENNEFDNLFLTNVSEHSKIHKEYEEVFIKLYKMNLIDFDKNRRGVDWQSFEKLLKKLKV